MLLVSFGNSLPLLYSTFSLTSLLYIFLINNQQHQSARSSFFPTFLINVSMNTHNQLAGIDYPSSP